ncbi:MAG: RsmE family RNA methyltransferase [Spirochaetia bacterium]|nr:RsmE family RNA methyltransferase [Spirochaetia bacterium]
MKYKFPWFDENEIGPFYLNDTEWKNYEKKNKYNLPKRHLYHIRKSLRLKNDLCISLTNGINKISKAILYENDSVEKTSENIKINSNYAKYCTVISPVNKKALQIIIQKSVELGVYGFYLIKSDRANYKIPSIERLKTIAENAMFQAKNPIMPIFNINLNNIFDIKDKKDSLYFWGDSDSENSLSDIIDPKNRFNEIIFINGPEGGWSTREKEFLKNNFHSIGLSDNVLRVETAAICAAYHAKLLIRNISESKR